MTSLLLNNPINKKSPTKSTHYNQVGARCLEAGAWGAYYNVLVNLDNLLEGPERNSYQTQAEDLLQKARRGCETVLNEVEKRVE